MKPHGGGSKTEGRSTGRDVQGELVGGHQEGEKAVGGRKKKGNGRFFYPRHT